MAPHRIFAVLLCLNLAALGSQAEAESFGSRYEHPSQYRLHQVFQPQHQRLNSHKGFTIELSELGDLIGLSNIRPRLASARLNATAPDADGEAGSIVKGPTERLGAIADRLLPGWIGHALEESAEVVFSTGLDKRSFRPRSKYASAPSFLRDAFQQAHYQVNLYGNTSTFVVGWLF